MNTTTIEEKGELITLAETNTKALFDGSGMDSMLAQIEQKARSYDLDISTPSGRKEVASVAYKIAQSKTAIDTAGKKLVEGIKAEAKVIDDERKKARDFLDSLKDDIRKPLTDFENAEKERIATLETRLARIEALCLDIPEDSGLIQALLNRLNETTSGTFEEFEKRAAGLIAVAKERLTAKLEVVAKREAEAAELARLRADEIERDRIARDKEIADNAAAKAMDDAAALIKDANDRAAKAEQDAKDKLAREAKELADAEAKRAANKKHREKVLSEVASDMNTLVISSCIGNDIAEAIANGIIRHVSIQF